MRPALDSKVDEAIRTFAEYVRNRLDAEVAK